MPSKNEILELSNFIKLIKIEVSIYFKLKKNYLNM